MADAIALVGPYGTDKIRATAALDALLAAVVEMGVGRNAVCVDQELRTSETGWMAASYWTEYEEGVPALILQLEEKP